jgi:hypothetical protein
VRHLAIVAAQAGRDFQFDCFPAGPTSLHWVSALRCKLHGASGLRNGGRATAFDIVRRGDDNAVVVGQLAIPCAASSGENWRCPPGRIRKTMWRR